MSNVYDTNPQELVKAAAQKLKEKVKKPDYINYVKSGSDKERTPQDPDFFFVRSASVLRQVYLNGPVGVSRLRTRYGSGKEHRVHRHHHIRSGGSVISDSFKALEQLNYIKKTKRGRVITPQGKSFLDKTCKEIKGDVKKD
ncbi:MAG: 30S ribosomal protein S19e [Candidatus Marsarchaeota archaeon]|nr:30S ribosomal protein S19e [Candidatus Marsarchaeota archaeon]